MSGLIPSLVTIDDSVLTEANKYRIEKPRTYGARLQNNLVKSVERAAETAVQAADKAVKFAMSSHTDNDALIENAVECNKASVNAEEKVNFLLRRAKLANHINSVEDFQYLRGMTDDEKNTLCSIVIEMRKDVKFSKRIQLERMAYHRKLFENFRKNVIDRLAKSPTETDAALRS